MPAKTSTDNVGKPFAIYCRLRGKKPVKPGARAGRDSETVERQEHDCREYAAAHGLPIADHLVFVDPNYSAWKRKGAVRPAWLEMMAAVERGDLAGILVYKLGVTPAAVIANPVVVSAIHGVQVISTPAVAAGTACVVRKTAPEAYPGDGLAYWRRANFAFRPRQSARPLSPMPTYSEQPPSDPKRDQLTSGVTSDLGCMIDPR